MRRFFLGILTLTLLIPSISVAKEPPNQPVQVVIHDTAGKISGQFYPFGNAYFGKASITTADIDADGNDEIIVGAGQQQDPLVKIFKQDGTLLNTITAYHPSFRLGLQVAACDVTGDGMIDIITGPSSGGGPHVRVFNAQTGVLQTQFFAYEQNFLGGVQVACGNVDNDSANEIITTPGLTGGPHLRVFNATGELKRHQFIGTMPSNSGLELTIANMDNQGPAEIITTELQDGAHYLFVSTFDSQTDSYLPVHSTLLSDSLDNISISTFSFAQNDTRVLVSDGYANSRVRIYTTDGKETGEFKPFTTVGHGSQTVQLNTTKGALQVSMNDSGNVRFSVGKHILVDISEQRLYAFEHGELEHTFLISSGLPRYETPRGKFDVMAKLPTHTYRWIYGDGDVRNYEIPNVKWNVRFLRHFYIHSATWHNNFGKKMSHGCVNMRPEEAKIIFDWSELGATVEVID